MTRSQTKLFRLLDLPAEVRIRLYHYQALSLSNAVPMDLGFVDLPPSLSLNRQTREEALPVFFSSNRFKITVGSNWCVRNKHFHDDRDYDWVNFGHLRLSRTLTGLARAKEGEGGLNEKVIRFRHVTMDLTCACCHGPRHIGTVELTVEGHTAVVKCEDVLKRMGTVEEMYLKVVGLDAIFLEVEKVVEAIKKRQDFNGFTVDDLVAVAGCFRLKPPKDD